MVTVSSHQPLFLPYTGYWAKIAASDTHIVLTGVQFIRDDYLQRTKIAGNWFGLPLDRSTIRGPIKDVRVQHSGLDNAASRLLLTYGKKWAGHQNIAQLAEVLNRTTTRWLWEIDLVLMVAVADLLKIEFDLAIDDVVPDRGLSKTERLVAHVLRHTAEGDGVQYLAGGGTMTYLNFEYVPKNWSIHTNKRSYPEDSIVDYLAKNEIPDLTSAWGAVARD